MDKPYETEELLVLARRIELLAEHFEPTEDLLKLIFPQLRRFGYAPVLPNATKLWIAILLAEENTSILFTDVHPEQHYSKIEIYYILKAVAKHLPDSLLKKCFEKPGITWLEAKELSFISINLTEDELSNILIESWFESPADCINEAQTDEGETIRSKMND